MTEPKASPALKPFLSEGQPDQRRDAIVILRTPPFEESEQEKIQTRLSDFRRRLLDIEGRSSEKIRLRVAENYASASRKLSKDKQALGLRRIGRGYLPVASAEITARTLPLLAKNKDVLAILPNQKLFPVEPQHVQYRELLRTEAVKGMTWGLEALEIRRFWETSRGKGIRVAVMDSGAYGDHPSLAARVESFAAFDPLGRLINASPCFDAGQHGTHVCGTIAGSEAEWGSRRVSIGVAPEAKLLPAAILLGGATTLKALVAGLDWAFQRGANVVNLSLGFPNFDPDFDILLDMLIDKYGIFPAVAIGNDSHGSSSSPGNSPNAFSVGAVERRRNRAADIQVAPYSGGASLVFPGPSSNALVNNPDVVAPGTQVFSCIPPRDQDGRVHDSVYMSGTSMATPHVAGVAALLMAARPKAGVRTIMQALRETAWHPTGYRPDNRWGYGFIRPNEALESL